MGKIWGATKWGKLGGKYTPYPEVYRQHKLDPMGITFFKKKNVFQFIIELLCDPAFLLMDLPEELKSESWKDGNNIIHNSQDMKMF